jgi:hypothetical protein
MIVIIAAAMRSMSFIFDMVKCLVEMAGVEPASFKVIHRACYRFVLLVYLTTFRQKNRADRKVN